MTRGFAFIGLIAMLVCSTALAAEFDSGAAKKAPVGHAAIPIYPAGNCASYPININTPGGYLLSGNITLPAGCGADAIDVKADNVVLDLGGYTITGTGAGTGLGINGSTHSNVTVKNGSVINMGGGGISLGSSSTIEEVTASSNGTNSLGFGIRVGNGIVRHVHANFNKGGGIECTTISTTASSEVSDSEVSNNSNNAVGIELNHAGIVQRNSVYGNSDDGIETGHPAVISNNNVGFNGFDGIFAAGQISNNTIVNNGNNGISFGPSTIAIASVVGNTIADNAKFGISGTSVYFSYGNNQLFSNNETTPPHPADQVSGGVQMGPNICDGVACP